MNIYIISIQSPKGLQAFSIKASSLAKAIEVAQKKAGVGPEVEPQTAQRITTLDAEE